MTVRLGAARPPDQWLAGRGLAASGAPGYGSLGRAVTLGFVPIAAAMGFLSFPLAE
jgi:hypothetical protein